MYLSRSLPWLVTSRPVLAGTGLCPPPAFPVRVPAPRPYFLRSLTTFSPLSIPSAFGFGARSLRSHRSTQPMPSALRAFGFWRLSLCPPPPWLANQYIVLWLPFSSALRAFGSPHLRPFAPSALRAFGPSRLRPVGP